MRNAERATSSSAEVDECLVDCTTARSLNPAMNIDRGACELCLVRSIFHDNRKAGEHYSYNVEFFRHQL